MARDRKALQTELNRILGHLDSLASELKGIDGRFKDGRTAANAKRDAERIDEIRRQMGLK